MSYFARRFLLGVPSSTENLAMIRDFVGKIAQQAGLNEVDTCKLELAVDEACANVIEHAYQSDATQEVELKVTLEDDEIRIAVLDTGQGFDPAAVEQMDLKQLVRDRKSGGLGMRMMKSFMDEIQYQIVAGGKNELHMRKRLHK